MRAPVLDGGLYAQPWHIAGATSSFQHFCTFELTLVHILVIKSPEPNN